MDKGTISVIVFVLVVATGLAAFLIPINSRIAYTAKLVKVEYHDWGPDYYYFSNGRVESFARSPCDVVIGGIYEVSEETNVFGMVMRKSARLIGNYT